MSAWANLLEELMHEIMSRLEIPDLLRSEAVCKHWSWTVCKENHPKFSSPWLMLSSSDDDKIKYRYFYSLTENKTYKLHLPEIAGQHCVGTSQGYLLSVNDNADLVVTNPLSGGACLPFPPTTTCPDIVTYVRDSSSGKITEYEVNKIFLADPCESDQWKVRHMQNHYFRKAILSPDAHTAVILHGGNLCWLSFSRSGDESWTALETLGLIEFRDVIFHKGLLYAINVNGTLVIYNLDRSCDPIFVSPRGPLKNTDVNRYIVESPDGDDLFLVLRVYDFSDQDSCGTMKSFQVYLLDKNTHIWNEVKSLGDIALFLGFNYSIALCTRQFSMIKRNCIYFTNDDKGCYINKPERSDDKGVYNMEEECLEQIYSDCKLDQLNWPPPVWFMPVLH